MTAADDATSPSSEAAGGSRKRRVHPLLVVLGIGVLTVAVLFGVPAIYRALDSPPLSEEFGTEDAVVALRLQAHDRAYLVLIDQAGRTRSVRLDERGFENARIAWSQDGLSTGGPDAEYVIRDEGLTRFELQGATESSSERQRLVVDDGFAIYDGSAEGEHLIFVDAQESRATTVDTQYASAEFATCDGELVVVDDDGVRSVTSETEDFTGFGFSEDLIALVCDGDRVYGLGEIENDEASSRQGLRVWDRMTGAMSTAEIHYSKDVNGSPNTPFVHGGRLYWTSDARVWSIPVQDGDPKELPAGTLEAVSTADTLGPTGDLWPGVHSDDGALAHAGRCVVGTADDQEYVRQSRGHSWDKLVGFGVFTADVESGERRIAIEVDDIDFPLDDVTVIAVAVDPDWVPEGC